MYRTLFCRTFLALGIFSLALTATPADENNAQEGDPAKSDFATPGKHHKAIDFMAGEWVYEGKMYPDPKDPSMSFPMKGKVSRKWILDGRYLREEVNDESGGPTTPFHGIGVLGYDNHKKKYVSAWIDNHGTGIATAEGTWDDATKTFSSKSVGEVFNPHLGKPTKTRDVAKMISKDEMQAEMFQIVDGKEQKVMTFTMRRQK